MTLVFPPQFALLQSFTSSSFVGQAVVVVLMLFSIMAWTAMLFKSREFARIRSQNQRFVTAFRKERHPFVLFLKQQRFADSPTYRLYLRSCQSAARTLGMSETDISDLLAGTHSSHMLTSSQLQVIREAAERELADQILLMEKDMTILATTTTVAPFMGLLGTVWGVMEAFNGMAASASPTSSAVISGISAALLTTVIGLLVAIPTVIGYNVLSVRLRNETVGMDNFVQELVGEFHYAYVKEG
jgi:biopolymer transport protein TolQ